MDQGSVLVSDMEEFIALLTRWGVTFDHYEDSWAKDIQHVRIYQDNDNPKNVGYNQFYTDVEFTAAGKFIRMGAWE